MTPDNEKAAEALARRRTFIIELADATDAVMRVLEAFALGGARLAGLDMAPVGGDGLRLKVTALGLDEIRADRIRRRLSGLPVVRELASGWVSG